MTDSTVTIIGLGAVGNTLAEACLQNSVSLKSVVTTNKKKAAYFSERNISVFNTIKELPIDSDSIIFITVPDDSIADVVTKIAQSAKDQSFPERVIFTHCSGAITSDVLKPLASAGASAAAFHPLQTFSLTTGGDRFRDIFISIEGEEVATQVLKKIAELLGASPVFLSREQKRSLHTAAVFASNYLVAVMHAAESIALNAGIDEPMLKMRPLIQQTMQNIFSGGPDDALSGPVRRGDLHTVKDHLNLLVSEKNVRELYISAGLYLTSMLENQKGIDSERNESLKNLFRNEQRQKEK